MKQTLHYTNADVEKLVRADAIQRMGLVPTAGVVVSLTVSKDSDRGQTADHVNIDVTFDADAQVKAPETTQTTSTLKCPSPHSKDGKCDREALPGGMTFRCRNCGRM